jgi:hypothetical protein
MTTEQMVQIAEGFGSFTGDIPKASDENLDPDRFWESDPCDDVIPSHKGFVSDCIYYTRGREVASLFVVWSSLFAVAGAVKRDAWLQWADSQLFANLYFMIVAPAGAVKKNTAANLAIDLLDYLDTEVLDITKDTNIAGMKKINPFMSKATPEALVTAMMPEAQRGKQFIFTNKDGSAVTDGNGEALKYYPRSEICIAQHELSTFAGKSSFMDSLIPFLLNMYDSPLRWSNSTQIRGKEELREVLVNFMGNITPAALKETLPVAATADGFLSRCLIVYQAFTERSFFRPVVPKNAPRKPELRKRLAWIAANTFGAWDFTPEAEDWARRWYTHYKNQLSMDGLHMGVKSRLDVILYKTALLIRWQRYERDDQFIHVCDLEDANALLTRTFSEAVPIYRMLFDDKAGDKSLKVEEYIKRVGTVSRTDLIQKAHVPAEEAYYAVNRLAQEGLIRIYNGSRQLSESVRAPQEIYVWDNTRADVTMRSFTPNNIQTNNTYNVRRMPTMKEEQNGKTQS